MEILVAQDKVVEEIVLNSAIRDRRIYFNSEVTRDSVFKAVHFLNRLVDLDKKQGTKEDIEIILDCEGGMIYFGMSLVSKILELREMGYRVVITVHSIAMSMGFMFLIIGSHRRAMKYSTIMVHQPSSGTWGTLQEMEDDIEETNRLWRIMKDIIVKYTNIPGSKLDEIKQRKQDWFMDSVTGLSLNCIDEII